MTDVRRLDIPPHSVEAEQSVLGSMLISSTACALVCDRIRPDDFYRNDHRLIFAAIAKLHGTGAAVDAVTVSEQLERTGKLIDAGGLAYIGKIVRDTPTAANVETYAAVVKDRAASRRLQKLGAEIAKSVSDGSGRTAEELTARAQDKLLAIYARTRTGEGLKSAADLTRELVDDLDSRADGKKGLSVGLPDFDELTNGLDPGDLVLIAGRPSMGKTAIEVTIADHVSKSIGVAVFSAEMPTLQIMRRHMSLEAKIPQGKLRRTELLTDADWKSISECMTPLSQRKLWIDATPAPSLTHIRAECISLKSRETLGLVLVDYVQLVVGSGANRYEELRQVAYGFKALAKELSVPIILLAQLNRSVESRESKRPAISDLRDSGALEEAADIIGLLYRQGYYDPDFSMPYVLECHIAKNRNGQLGGCLWHFDGALSKVSQLDSGAAIQYRRLLSTASSSRSSKSADL